VSLISNGVVTDRRNFPNDIGDPFVLISRDDQRPSLFVRIADSETKLDNASRLETPSDFGDLAL
jgi:hypothetical protein